jgi:hypothetical protein
VYLATRNEQGTKDAIRQLEKEGVNDGSLHWLKLELGDPRSAKSAAEEFLKKEDRLDILGVWHRLLFLQRLTYNSSE